MYIITIIQVHQKADAYLPFVINLPFVFISRHHRREWVRKAVFLCGFVATQIPKVLNKIAAIFFAVLLNISMCYQSIMTQMSWERTFCILLRRIMVQSSAANPEMGTPDVL